MEWKEFFLIAAIALPAACLFLLMRLQQDIRKALLIFLNNREADREAQTREKNGKPDTNEIDTTC